MATQTSSVTRTVGLFSVAAVIGAVALSACTPRPDGPEPAAEKFFAALATGDTSAAAQLSDRPDDAKTALSEAWNGLQATRLDAQILGSKYSQDTGSVAYRYTWHLPKNRTWTYDGQLNMVRDEGRWEVRWSATGLHPRLGEHQTFALRADAPRRASVNERGGTDVLVPGQIYHYALDARAAGAALMPTARAVADALRPFIPAIDPQLLAEQASSSAQPMSLLTLQQADHDRVAPAIAGLAGVVVTPQAEMLPTDPTFAPAIVNEVKKAVGDDLEGEAGWRVVTVNQNGVDVDVLNEVAGQPAPSVTISLDRAVQNAAQNAVNTTGKKAMIVAIKPSTGEILAVAQNAAADADGPLATMGQFPPGSTFKIVTAGAAIERDMATPNSLLGCPGTLEIGHRIVTNYDAFDLGTVPMSRAFANSCNTTFAELASKMPPRGLTQAAAQYGIGTDYQVEGIPTVTGSVPPTVSLAERTEDGFGQGKVLVSPFGMALVASTVAAGKTPVPQLIEGHQTMVDGAGAPISPKMLDGLRPMMRLVVTNGTAKDLNGFGDVRGKTGEAEFDGGSHSWFAGYRGDLAFAALIVGGGSSEYAVRMCKTMFDGLPPDYLA
ncbi:MULTISPECIES: penicillin-binding transpeptidase domain-containing protein [Mycolicibacterium]|uniref:penicillin-binding transpeptidase domain-containing protein n=1 Tax=Mycolicibacterium TaxID=1866885 RepID=UPI000433C6CF|nr:penicillin-binding transpeptidase domain-containing protein [Mycolicibacterium mageritense]MCC9181502.1 penicillin-binding transpeptidase domain-containing protein [Mycolicibacterium mageritense]OKH76271.1 penicillin-binding protein [Mycobacterium sp. SWH-M3]TXI61104.1 MAG: penicillin-binding transpeptidase domain-containing protein [Mycolicibacterium mageritense]CDO24406.1 penicillin-binding protein [Mycolicibacterium mageritense DSM 44476 = CIP 104973]